MCDTHKHFFPSISLFAENHSTRNTHICRVIACRRRLGGWPDKMAHHHDLIDHLSTRFKLLGNSFHHHHHRHSLDADTHSIHLAGRRKNGPLSCGCYLTRWPTSRNHSRYRLHPQVCQLAIKLNKKQFKWKEKESDSKNIDIFSFFSWAVVGGAQIGSYRQPNKKKIKRQQRPNGHLSLSRSLLCNDPLCGITSRWDASTRFLRRGRSDTNRS